MSCICGYLHFTRDLQYESFYLSQYILQFIIYITLDGDIRIAYDDSDDYVHIICKSYGQIKVEAQLGGSWRDNWVKLLLNTDQTVLNKVIQQCNSILKN